LSWGCRIRRWASGPFAVRLLAAALTAVVPLIVTAPGSTGAQPSAKPYRVGVIVTAAPSEFHHLARELDSGLRELGYVEGQNLVFERRFAEGQQERLPALATELVQLKVDVIVTGSNPVIAAVKQATTTIPVVMAVSRDPVGAGFVASLARPGGNITGLSNDPSPDILGKNLELLREAVPRASRVAFLWNPTPPGAVIYRKAAESAAQKLGVTLQTLAIRRPAEFESVFASMVRDRASAILVAQDPLFFSARGRLTALAAKHRLPAIYGNREYTEAGGLMSYGPNIAQQYRRAATYVDKILKGAKPADLAVEQPTKFELLINLRVAKAIDVTISPSLRLQADHVIE
jgi:putative tryptophan/tyrosine transport system substrate-binding protein